jgi:hypothetical protein
MFARASAAVNIAMGGVWLLGQGWLWIMMGGVGGIHYSFKGFAYYSLFLVLMLSGPVLLILGSWLSLSKPASIAVVILTLFALIEMGFFLLPPIYESMHPAPLEYVDYKFTGALAIVFFASCAATCCLCIGFVRDKRKTKRLY